MLSQYLLLIKFFSFWSAIGFAVFLIILYADAKSSKRASNDSDSRMNDIGLLGLCLSISIWIGTWLTARL